MIVIRDRVLLLALLLQLGHVGYWTKLLAPWFGEWLEHLNRAPVLADDVPELDYGTPMAGFILLFIPLWILLLSTVLTTVVSYLFKPKVFPFGTLVIYALILYASLFLVPSRVDSIFSLLILLSLLLSLKRVRKLTIEK
ncbi:hypothetical protein [Entomospira culicis]|uniref:Uncharacterized protein n=1 Tax=Entomospira culicis TaxID=2719989 RepID=A0A968KZM9_9SPIO|nr:hypothetical protein [Entomospira culicis]NIZ19594.1 hypothetical protein [Entomospira culicis]NIZ69501.1 hypothetical protein [Entomospira culicis]WDI36616.1 hypothetical protein PVA46_04635 [Entomospira culicis]WDI38244.1 hypothetical protein PVA47_04645 [Entomospira culicis]